MIMVDVGWSQAQWKRLFMFEEADDFGVRFGPENTAPFLFRRSTTYGDEGVLDILMGNLYIGEIRNENVRVRTDFPEKFHFAIQRAMRGLCEVNDEIGRLDRARKREQKADEDKALKEFRARSIKMPAASLLVIDDSGLERTYSERINGYRISLPPDTVRKGVFGLFSIDDGQEIIISSENKISIIVAHPENPQRSVLVSFFKNDQGGFNVMTLEHKVRINESAVEGVILEGVKRWEERVDEDSLVADISAAGSLPRMDISSIKRLKFNTHPAESDKDEMRVGGLVVKRLLTGIRFGGIVVKGDLSEMREYEAFHNGQFLSRFIIHRGDGFVSNCYAGPDICGAKLDEEQMGNITNVAAHHICSVEGIDPDTVRAISEETIARTIDSIDFGYDI